MEVEGTLRRLVGIEDKPAGGRAHGLTERLPRDRLSVAIRLSVRGGEIGWQTARTANRGSLVVRVVGGFLFGIEGGGSASSLARYTTLPSLLKFNIGVAGVADCPHDAYNITRELLFVYLNKRRCSRGLGMTLGRSPRTGCRNPFSNTSTTTFGSPRARSSVTSY